MLIASETELIDIESQFAKIMNIPDKSYKSGVKDVRILKNSVRIQDLPKKPIQWRILIYIKDFLEVEPE